MNSLCRKSVICAIVFILLFFCEPVVAVDQQAIDYFKEANYYWKLNDYDKVVELYEKALEIDPNYTEARYNLYFAFYESGKYEEAIATVDKLLEKSPEYPYMWGARADALVQLGRYEEALDSYERDLKIRPNNFNAVKGRDLCLEYLSINASTAMDTISSQITSPQATTTILQKVSQDITSVPDTTKAPIIYAPVAAIGSIALLSIWQKRK